MLTDLICYDLKVAALIAVFYLFYKLLLARETTHSLNRAVLLLAIVLSVLNCGVCTGSRAASPVSPPLFPLQPLSMHSARADNITIFLIVCLLSIRAHILHFLHHAQEIAAPQPLNVLHPILPSEQLACIVNQL